MKNELLETYSLGPKLRALRQEKHLTLSRLAAETGLSTALLSKLETGSLVPTLATLARLCRTFGIGLGYFFSDVTDHTLAITRKAHVAQRSRAPQTIKTIPLHVPASESRLITKIIECLPGAVSRFGEQGQRNETTIYVLEGTLQLNFAGTIEILEAGDCAVLNTTASGIWGAVEKTGCRALIVALKSPANPEQ